MVDPKEAKRESDTVALNCLHGLYALTLCCRKKEVISECVITMVNIMGILSSHQNTKAVKDPNKVRSNVVRKLLFLLIRSLAFSTKNQQHHHHQEQGITSEDEERKEELRKEWLLHNNTTEETLCLTTDATSSALWFISEWLISPNQHKMYPDLSQSQRTEVMNGILCLLSSSFPSFEPTLKLHSIHFASKLLLFLSSLGNDQNAIARASNILAQGRLDLNLDVRDRARFESSLLYQVIPSNLVDFPEGMNHATAAAIQEKKLTLEQGKQILLASKPPSTFLPVDLGEKNKEEIFRFGTLSSLVHHRAGRAYLPLPPWAEKDSDAKLRDPTATSTSSSGSTTSQNNRIEKKEKGFYDDDDTSSSSSESDSDDESESESDSDESSSSSSDESESDESDDESDSEESSSEYNSSSSDEDSDDEIKNNVNAVVESKVGNLIGLGNTDFVSNVSEPPPNHPNLPPNTTSKSMLDESSSSEEETSSSDSDTDSDTESDDDDSVVSMTNKMKGTNTIATSDTLLPMMSNMNMDSSSNTTNQKTNNNNKFNTSSSMSDDLSGLVMPPPVYDTIDEEEESSSTDDTSDLGPWERIVRPELAGGLAVDMRFVRRNTKKKELSRNNNLKFDLVNDRVILIQCRFQNK